MVVERINRKGAKPKQPPKEVLRYAEAITAAYADGVCAVIECGRLLIEAKAKLGHGRFGVMFSDGEFGKDSLLPFSQNTAQRYMKVAGNRVLSNPQFAQHLPDSWTTLHALSQVPEDELERLIASGEVHPDMTRADVAKLGSGQLLLAQFPMAIGTLTKIAGRYDSDPAILSEALRDEKSWSAVPPSMLRQLAAFLNHLANAQQEWMEETHHFDVVPGQIEPGRREQIERDLQRQKAERVEGASMAAEIMERREAAE